jgi:hypothetical protein
MGLQTDVEAKYDVAEGYPMVGAHPVFGEIDLSTLTIEAADGLVANGFEGLVLKKAKSAKRKDEQ